MVITYLIGNGFDRNQGLKTGYKEFYPYFIDNASDTNRIKGWIDPTSELWSDMEYGLGQSLANVITEDDKNKFIEDKLELDDLLGDYLKEEATKFNPLPEEELISEIKRSIAAITSENTDAGTISIRNTLQQLSSQAEIKFNFISFNYTDVLEKSLDIARKNTIKLSIPQDPRTTRTGTLNRIFNVHGTIENGMIIGLNDKSQINNIELQNDEAFVKNIVKRSMNATLENNNTSIARGIISNSDILCIFGMSLGETDKMWWQEIVKWIKANTNHKLVIYNWVEPKLLHRNNPIRINFVNEQAKQKLFSGAEVDDVSTKELLSKQIIVLNNKNIFEFGYRKTDKQ